MTTPLLQAKDISVSYGKIEAVRNVNLTVSGGQIVTVIGPNGAGKSSLLKALMGALPSTGEVHYAGRNLNALSLEDRVEAGLFLVPEEGAGRNAGRDLRASPAPQGATPAAGRHPIRRRAADAGARPRVDGPPETADAG